MAVEHLCNLFFPSLLSSVGSVGHIFRMVRIFKFLVLVTSLIDTQGFGSGLILTGSGSEILINSQTPSNVDCW